MFATFRNTAIGANTAGIAPLAIGAAPAAWAGGHHSERHRRRVRCRDDGSHVPWDPRPGEWHFPVCELRSITIGPVTFRLPPLCCSKTTVAPYGVGQHYLESQAAETLTSSGATAIGFDLGTFFSGAGSFTASVNGGAPITVTTTWRRLHNIGSSGSP